MRRLAYAFLLVLLAIPALTQVRSPTLRDKVREQGFVWEGVDGHYPRTLGSLNDLITMSDLIIRGRVVNERTRLSPEETLIWTDYTIEVLEVYQDPHGLARVGERLQVSKTGGNLLLEGKPVRMDSPKRPPIPWIAPHVLFLSRPGPGAHWDYHFTGVLGVFRLE